MAILINPPPIRHMTKIIKISLLRLTGKICSTPTKEKKSTNYLGIFGDRKEKNCLKNQFSCSRSNFVL